MERTAFIAALGALVPSVVLIQLNDRHLVRSVPPACNFVLDATPFPVPGMIHDHLACMGDAGRTLYADFYRFDLVLFPLIYSTALAGVLYRVWPTAPWLRLLPLFAAMADVAENVCISFLLSEFPTHHEQVQVAVSWLTPTKWGFLTVATVVVLVGAVQAALAWAARKPQHGKTA